jgi:hypothetical protein
VTRLARGQVFEFDGELGGLLGRDLEAKRLDGDEPPLQRVVSTKNGTEAAGPYLMQDSEGTERSRWRLVQGTVGAQRWCSSDRDEAVKGS